MRKEEKKRCFYKKKKEEKRSRRDGSSKVWASDLKVWNGKIKDRNERI